MQYTASYLLKFSQSSSYFSTIGVLDGMINFRLEEFQLLHNLQIFDDAQ